MISQKDVAHIAHLARIALTDAEKKKFEKELSAILAFVEELNEADTSTVAEMTGGTRMENVMREDDAIDASLEGNADQLLSAVPSREERLVKVKAVFE